MNRTATRVVRLTVFTVIITSLALFSRDVMAGASGSAMIDAAQRVIASLDDAARAKTLMSFDDPRRLDWHNIPKANRKGLRRSDMTDARRNASDALVRAGLSESGFAKAMLIMSLENNVLDGERKHGANGNTPLRDQGRYYLTIFGTPAPAGTWGWSFEGHHLSLNYVIKDGQVIASTPSFWGANPATIHEFVEGGPPIGTRTLADEEQPAFDLITSLSDAQRAKAVIAEKSPAEYRNAGKPLPPMTPPQGCAGADMDDAQRATLLKLIEAYHAHLPTDVADSRRAEINADGVEKIYFAWAGGINPGQPHSFRVQGPSFLLELVNYQSDPAGNPSNHIHSVWRSLRNDFGVPTTRPSR